jgi:hypothetical protein
MGAHAKQSKHRERSQWTAREIGYVLATLARVITRDFVVSQNKNFGRNPRVHFISILFVSLALGGSGWSTPRLGRFTPGKDLAPIV